MSNYDKNTKFYWLQLKEDFFEEDAIQWLEEQEPKGREYAYFYLKLCLKSLKNNGVLIRKVGNILIPYDNKKLAELTKIDFDTVTVAMELLKKIGLIEILEHGEIYMTQLDEMIGSTSKGAFKKQQQLARRKKEEQKQIEGGTGVENFPPKIKIELKKEIELDIEEDIDNKTEEEEEPKKTKSNIPYEQIKDLFNSICTSYSKVTKLTDARKRLIKARYEEYENNISILETLFKKAEDSDFLKGNNNNGWKANFDWLLNTNNMIKVLEDNYKNKQNTSKPSNVNWEEWDKKHNKPISNKESEEISKKYQEMLEKGEIF